MYHVLSCPNKDIIINYSICYIAMSTTDCCPCKFPKFNLHILFDHRNLTFTGTLPFVEAKEASQKIWGQCKYLAGNILYTSIILRRYGTSVIVWQKTYCTLVSISSIILRRYGTSVNVWHETYCTLVLYLEDMEPV